MEERGKGDVLYVVAYMVVGVPVAHVLDFCHEAALGGLGGQLWEGRVEGGGRENSCHRTNISEQGQQRAQFPREEHS